MYGSSFWGLLVCVYKHFLIIILLPLPPHSSCSHHMENAGGTMLPNPLFSPLPNSLFTTSTPKPYLAYFTPPCLRAAHKWVQNAHTHADTSTHVYTNVLFSRGLGGQHGLHRLTSIALTFSDNSCQVPVLFYFVLAACLQLNLYSIS